MLAAMLIANTMVPAEPNIAPCSDAAEVLNRYHCLYDKKSVPAGRDNSVVVDGRGDKRDKIDKRREEKSPTSIRRNPSKPKKPKTSLQTEDARQNRKTFGYESCDINVHHCAAL